MFLSTDEGQVDRQMRLCEDKEKPSISNPNRKASEEIHILLNLEFEFLTQD